MHEILFHRDCRFIAVCQFAFVNNEGHNTQRVQAKTFKDYNLKFAENSLIWKFY